MSLLVWVYRHSGLCSGLQKTHLFCNRVRFGRSRLSKVDAFGTSRKRVRDFLLVGHCDCDSILHRFWDTATYWLKIAYFSYTSLIRRPCSLCSLWNFAVKFTVRKLDHGAILQWRPHDRSLSRFDTVPACDRRTDRRTDGFTIAGTALCIASYADAL